MNYFEHNDSKGRDSRRAVELNKAERATAQGFDGTLFMRAGDVFRRRLEGRYLTETPWNDWADLYAAHD